MQQVAHYVEAVDKGLETYFPSLLKDSDKSLRSAMLYALQGKSKRIRPLLVCITATALGLDYQKCLPLACAIEYIHTYSLIHDDLPMMDNDDFRRNRPSCHKQFSESTALLAGDTLQMLAIECICKELSPFFEARNILNCLQHLSQACGLEGMAQGQYLDIAFTEKSQVELEDVQQIHTLKTTQLLKASVLCTCDLSDHRKEHAILIQFATDFGNLFQSVDDILDAIGSKDSLGKTPQKDAKNNKPSLLKIFSLEDAKKYAFSIHQKCLEHLKALEHLHTDDFEYLLEKIVSPIR